MFLLVFREILLDLIQSLCFGTYAETEFSIYGFKHLSCGCITHSELDHVDSDRKSTVYFGNKAYNVGQPSEST